MKYGNRKTTLNGITFDSAREAARWSHLRILERAGHISELRRQVPFVLAPSVKFAGARAAKPAMRYVADFEYVENGARIVEDVKSPATASIEAFRMKRHLMKSVHGIENSHRHLNRKRSHMSSICDAYRKQETPVERIECETEVPNIAADITAGWRARRSQLRAQRLKASAEPSLAGRSEPVAHAAFDDGLVDCSGSLSELLTRWHRWQIGFSPVPTCSADPMFRNAKSGKGWDSTGEVIRDELNGSTMEAIDFHVGELPDKEPEQPYRSAIYTIAKNLHAGANVWTSARLPADPMERGIVFMEARNMLMRRLIAAGVM